MPDKTTQITIRALLSDASRAVARHETEILLAHILHRDRVLLLAHDDTSVKPADTKRFRMLVAKRRNHVPIAYLTGHKKFYERSFTVNKHVLIPRPETELLIERVLHRLREKKRTTIIWDVGTGSGAIAVTLAKEIPRAAILATDVSTRALSVARANAKRLGVTRSITFLKSNLLQPVAYRWLAKHGKKQTRLIITANLPYLPSSDKKVLQPDVVKYEPASALFSGSDGLLLINRFLRQLARHLPDWRYHDAAILLEFDPPQAATLKKIVRKLFPHASVTIHRDLAGRNRVMEIIPTGF